MRTNQLKDSSRRRAWLRAAVGLSLLPLQAARAATPRPGAALTALATSPQWLNTPPLTADELRGKVVVVAFWTYSCINSLRVLPYLRAWSAKYQHLGFVVVGVHTPEFLFEHDLANVRRAVADLGVAFPVALDSDSRIWRTYDNNAWPAFYFIGADGQVRDRAIGEGDYDRSERLIQTLLREAQAAAVPGGIAEVSGEGPEAAPDFRDLGSGETYIGYGQATAFASPGGARKDVASSYRPPSSLALNRWSLAGDWTIGEEFATLNAPAGQIAHHFRARDLHMVLGPAVPGRALRFRVRIDGKPPEADHGWDVDASGAGMIGEPRMYQLIRQRLPVADRRFEIEFLDPGVRAYVFTFG